MYSHPINGFSLIAVPGIFEKQPFCYPGFLHLGIEVFEIISDLSLLSPLLSMFSAVITNL